MSLNIQWGIREKARVKYTGYAEFNNFSIKVRTNEQCSFFIGFLALKLVKNITDVVFNEF